MEAEILDSFEPQKNGPTLQKQVSFQKKKILIIDDEFDVRIALAELLVNEGYQVATAKDGAEGIRTLLGDERAPDLILLDLVMPVDAEVFRSEFSHLPQFRDVPIILMSGYQVDDLDLRGVQAFISKPFDYLEVLDSIGRALKKGE